MSRFSCIIQNLVEILDIYWHEIYFLMMYDFIFRLYDKAHMYHINSISLNSDDETYLSADDLRINLWHLDSTTECYNVVDIKPVNMEELTEVGCMLSTYLH